MLPRFDSKPRVYSISKAPMLPSESWTVAPQAVPRRAHGSPSETDQAAGGRDGGTAVGRDQPVGQRGPWLRSPGSGGRQPGLRRGVPEPRAAQASDHSRPARPADGRAGPRARPAGLGRGRPRRRSGRGPARGEVGADGRRARGSLPRAARPAKKKPASIGADERILRLFVLPALGRRKVAALGLKEIADLHHAMRDKPVQANRMLALLSKMLGLAERWSLRPLGSNPCRGVDRFPERRRDRFLSAAELERLGAVLSEEEPADPFVVLAIRLLLLSGARRDEVLTLRWSEVNFERACLSLPDSKTGAKLIPLGPAALALLADAPRLEGNPYVIPGRRTGGRLIGLQRPWVRIRERAGLRDLRLHDLRHYPEHRIIPTRPPLQRTSARNLDWPPAIDAG